jgi:hypothetical protein
MNSHAKTVIDFLESLRQTTKSISESRANKISSESLEDTFQQVLSDGGFVDLSKELKQCQDGKPSTFSKATTQSGRKEDYKKIKKYIQDIVLKSREIRQDIDNLFPKNCFLRHPCGPGNKPDFLVIVNGYMLYWEMKTSTGGYSGKLNDKPIPAQSFVLCSSGGKKLDCPFTWFHVADIYNDETWAFYDRILPLYKKYKNALREEIKDIFTDNVKKCASVPSLRGIVGWGTENNDWYRKTINGFDRAQREQNVINILKNL